MELLAGKLLGQMAVSLLALAFYVALGMALLVSFAMFGLFNPWLMVYLLIFFLITYFVFGAMMLTVGSAVNDMREAQSMMMPVMLLCHGAVAVLAAHLSRPELDVQHRRQLRPAGQHLRDAAADGVEHAAAVVAGVDLDRDRHRVGGRGAVVRREGLPDWPADVRQAAGLRHDGQMGQGCVVVPGPWCLVLRPSFVLGPGSWVHHEPFGCAGTKGQEPRPNDYLAGAYLVAPTGGAGSIRISAPSVSAVRT